MDASSSSASSLPYLGSKISLISNAEIRYEGILYSINTYESTVALQNVRSFGTEGRRQPDVPPNSRTYQFIIFKGKDIKDLTVCEPASSAIPEDPAIVTVNVPPASGAYGPGNRQGQQPNYPSGGHMNQGSSRGGYYGGGRGNMYANRNQYGGADHDHEYYPRGERMPPPRGGMNRNVGRNAQRRIVGELPPQPNQAIKKEVSKAFDFEGSNAKFDKGEAAKVKAEETKEESGAEAKVAVATPVRGYDKTTSFFDRISCETLDRKDGKEPRIDRDKQRQLDCDTFGAAAATVPRGLRPRRNFMRGGGPRRGYGGYGERARA